MTSSQPQWIASALVNSSLYIARTVVIPTKYNPVYVMVPRTLSATYTDSYRVLSSYKPLDESLFD